MRRSGRPGGPCAVSAGQAGHVPFRLARRATRCFSRPGGPCAVPAGQAGHALFQPARRATRHSGRPGGPRAVPAGQAGHALFQPARRASAGMRGRAPAAPGRRMRVVSLERVLRCQARVIGGRGQGSRVATLSCNAACHRVAAPRALGDSHVEDRALGPSGRGGSSWGLKTRSAGRAL